ncbi:MAG: hypothetical protein DRJ68_06725 [Thermoprotei archaeon]|nr:MAG: hypothetical protein DRJ68_06725 [Thermoprotei archaeon]
MSSIRGVGAMAHEFYVQVKWLGGVIGEAKLGDTGTLKFALPKEFGGVEGYFKPEELLLTSLVACYSVVVWRAVAKQRVELLDYNIDSKLVMEKDSEGRNVLTKAVVNVNIKAKRREDHDKIMRALEIAEKYCPIGRALNNSLKITYNANVTYED